MTPHLAALLSDLLSGPAEELGPRLHHKLDELGGVEALGAPVLICGCGHSGTTLMLSILGAHSQLQAIPFESSFVRRPGPEALDFQTLFNVLCLHHQRRRWVEKTPMHVHFMRTVLETMPNAQMILCLRDGRDVACSIRNRHDDFGMGVARWLRDNRAAEPFWTHPRVYVVRYESLVEDFEESLRPLLAFLGLDWEPQLVDFHRHTAEYYGGVARQDLMSVLRMIQQTRPQKKGPEQMVSPNNFEHRYWQMTQPIFDGRGIWKTQMSSRERQIFKAAAGEALIRYGYATNLNW